MDAIRERLRVALNARCLPRPLAIDPTQQDDLPCVVIEAQPPTDASCSCGDRRAPATPARRALVERQLAQRQQCGTATTPSCASLCLCELAPSEGTAETECLNHELGSNTPGYCYINPDADPPRGNPALVSECGSLRQMIRLVGPDTPKPGATAFIACLGETAR